MKRRLLTGLATALLTVSGFGLLELQPALFGAQAQTSTQETSQTDANQAALRLDEAQALLQDEQNTTDVIATYGPSVVAVNVEVRGQRIDPFSQGFSQDLIPPEFRRFFQLPDQQDTPQQNAPQQDTPQQDDLGEFRQQGSGSGFVVSEQGDIITNYHVARSALQEDTVTPLENTRLTVTFPSSDEEFPVQVVGVNVLYDLALLRLDNPSDLPAEVKPIPLGDSDALRVGQKTIAIGNPFGFASTVTTGIVSGVSRSLPGVGQTNIPLVQTDAAINPGNSGGPLLNSKGQLIGINTAIIPGLSANGERGNLGIGFAVPSNLLRQNLAELQSGGFADIRSRPRIGVGIADVRAYPENVRQSFNLPDAGVVVRTVEPGSPAEQAGLRGGTSTVDINGTPVEVGGDVITAVDGQEVTTPGELQDLVLSKNEGDTLDLRVLRDGQEQDITVTLSVVGRQETGQAPQNDTPQTETAPSGPRLGVGIQDIGSYPDEVRQSLNLPAAGVVVTEVAPDSPAAAAGLRGGQFALESGGEQYAAGGDVILAVNGQEVGSAEELQQIITGQKAGDTVELRIWRNGEEQTLNATLSEAEQNN
ncbi:N/A [soil metagenome]